MSYTLLGDTVNLASRLESWDKEWVDPELADSGCRILISEATRNMLGDQFQTKLVGHMDLHHIKEKVTIYCVVGETKPKGDKPS